MYMKSTKKKRILRAAMCITCAVTIASVNTSVYAEPSTNELEGKTSDLQGELSDLNSQLSALCDELDATSSKIEELSAAVEKSKLDVAAAKLNEDAQYDAMKDRIKFMYEGGSASLLEILFSSENMADFLNKAEFVTNISTYDRQMLDELQTARADIEKKQGTLETQQEELAGLQSDLKSKQEALNAKISSTSGELSEYSAQLERAKAAAAASRTAQDNSVAGPTTAPGKTDDGNNNSNTNKPSNNNGGNSTNKPSNASLGQQIASKACTYVGNPYVYGGTSLTNGADCSGFVQSVHKLFGISTPRDSWGQLAGGKAVSYSNILPGDVIVYSDHVAIYIGGNQIVHASNSKPYPAGGIKISSPANYRTVLGVRRYW